MGTALGVCSGRGQHWGHGSSRRARTAEGGAATQGWDCCGGYGQCYGLLSCWFLALVGSFHASVSPSSEWGKYGMGQLWLAGRSLPVLDAPNYCESRPAVASSILGHPIAARACQRLRRSLESGGRAAANQPVWLSQWQRQRAGSGGTSSAALSEHSRGCAFLSRSPTDAIPGFLFELCPASPPGWVWEGPRWHGQGRERALLPAGRCRSRPSLSADLHAHQHQLCCLSTAGDAGRAGLGGWAAVPMGALGALQSCREVGVRRGG